MSEPFDFSTVSPIDSPEPVIPNHRVGEDAPKPPRTNPFIRKPRGPQTPKTLKPKKEIPNRPGQFVEQLTQLYSGMALVAMPFDPEFAMTLLGPCRQPTTEDPEPMTVAQNCAVAWDKAAQTSPGLRRMLDSFLTATVWGAVFTAHAPLLLILAKNHTPFGAKFDPAAAMEAMLKRQQKTEEAETE